MNQESGSKGSKPRKGYTEEFKRSVVDHWCHSGKTAGQVEGSSFIHAMTMNNMSYLKSLNAYFSYPLQVSWINFSIECLRPMLEPSSGLRADPTRNMGACGRQLAPHDGRCDSATVG